MPPASLVPFDVIDDLVRTAESVPPGCFVEVGVYSGGTAWHLWQICAHQSRALHLFDTFAGMPFADPDDHHQVGEFEASLESVRKHIPEATYHVGVFPDTLPPDLSRIAFAHVDCDQRRSVAACIEHLWPRMIPGGVMWFDDYRDLLPAREAVDVVFRPKELTTVSRGRVFVRR